MKKPEFVLFDYGETLIHERSLDTVRGYSRVLRLAERNPYGIDAETLAAKAQELDASTTFFGYENGFEMSVECFSRILYAQNELEFKLSERELAEEFWRGTFENEAVFGAPEVIAWLNQSSIPYGVVSNISLSGKSLDKIIRETLTEFRPSFVLSSADYFFRKPHPIFMEIAVRKTKTPKDAIWFVGDKLHRDVKGAEAVGITPVLYDAKNRYPDARVTKIDRLDELIALFEKAK